MTTMLKRLAAITLSVIMALTLFPLVGSGVFTQAAFADDEIVQDDGAAGEEAVAGDEAVAGEEAPAAKKESVEETVPYTDKIVQNKGPESQNGDDEGWPAEVWPELDGALFQGQTKAMYIAGYEPGCTLEYKVGTGFNDWDDWSYLFTEDTHYTYDPDEQIIYLDGTKIFNALGGPGTITVGAALVDSEDTVISQNECEVEVKEPIADYYIDWEFRQVEPSTGDGWWRDRAPSEEYENYMFVGEKYKLYELMEAHVENAQHPDGDDVDLAVNTCVVEGDALNVVEKNYGWLITAQALGEATITISFEDIDGNTVTKNYSVTVSGERLFMGDIYYPHSSNEVVAGESVNVKIDAYYESATDPYQDEGITYQWWIDPKDAAYAEVAAEETDSPTNQIILRKVALETPYRYIKVWVEAAYTTEEGNTLTATSNNDDLYLCQEAYRITPTPAEIGNIDIGKKVTITPQLYKYYFDGTNTQREQIDATFRVKFEEKTYTTKNGKKVYSWKLKNNNNGSWTIERCNGKANDIEIRATSSALDFKVFEYYFFDKIRTNLSQYQIRLSGAITEGLDNIYYIDDSNEGITPEKIEVFNDWDSEEGYVLPETEYKLVVQKENEDGKWIASSMPFKFNKYPDDPYRWGNGAALYRVYAVSLGKHGFTKNTPKDDAWVYVYSKKTLNYEASTVKLNWHFDEYKCTDENDINYGYRYNLPNDLSLSKSAFNVATCGGTNAISMLDYSIQYREYHADYDDESALMDEYPDKPGMYWVVARGQRTYYGQNDWLLLVIGDQNPITVAKKTVTVNATKLKKAAQKAKPITKVEAVGDISYQLFGNKKLKINKTTGQVTVKKGTKKGTLKARVRIEASGDETYAPEYKYVSITIKVK